MMHQSGFFRASMCAVAVSVATAARAQEAAAPAAEAAQAPAEQQQPAKLFDLLVRVMNVQGACEVNNPDAGQFAPVQNNKAYPLGTVVRTGAGSTAVLVFSDRESVTLTENTEVVLAHPENNPDGRVVRLVSGKIKTDLRDNLAEGCFGVETPNASCKNLAGRGEYTISNTADAETFQAGTVTGSARIEGPQYQIPALRAANIVSVQTSADRSLSRLTGISGDFAIILSKGAEEPVNFGMSPKAVVKIWRQTAAVGGRPIISTLVVGPTGLARHRFAYADGRPCLATGELIAPQDENKEEKDLPVLLSTEAKKEAPAAEEQPAPAAEPAAVQ